MDEQQRRKSRPCLPNADPCTSKLGVAEMWAHAHPDSLCCPQGSHSFPWCQRGEQSGLRAPHQTQQRYSLQCKTSTNQVLRCRKTHSQGICTAVPAQGRCWCPWTPPARCWSRAVLSPAMCSSAEAVKEELPRQSPLLISLMFTLISGCIPTALATAPKDTQARNCLPDKGWE